MVLCDGGMIFEIGFYLVWECAQVTFRPCASSLRAVDVFSRDRGFLAILDERKSLRRSFEYEKPRHSERFDVDDDRSSGTA